MEKQTDNNGVEKTENKPPEATRPQIELALDSFVQEIGSLATTLPLVMSVVERASMAQSQQFVKYAKEKCKDVTEIPGRGFSLTVPMDVYQEYSNIKRKQTTLQLARKTVPRSFLTSLVSHYDAFLGALLRATFYLRPELLNTSEKPLTFKELAAFGSHKRRESRRRS